MAKDQKELFIIVEDMADHLPIEDPNKGEVQNMLQLEFQVADAPENIGPVYSIYSSVYCRRWGHWTCPLIVMWGYVTCPSVIRLGGAVGGDM